jgi:Uncharacterized small protein
MPLTANDKRASMPRACDDAVLGNGVQVAMAEYLFKEGILSLGKAAKVAGMPYVLFTEHLSRAGIPVVDYPPEELEDELR